jgi:hypothetical protein
VAAGMVASGAAAAALAVTSMVVLDAAAAVSTGAGEGGPWRRARRAERALLHAPKGLWQPVPQWALVVPHQPLQGGNRSSREAVLAVVLAHW